MQILIILRNWKFTYKRNSRVYTCVYKEKIYYSFFIPWRYTSSCLWNSSKVYL